LHGQLSAQQVVGQFEVALRDDVVRRWWRQVSGGVGQGVEVLLQEVATVGLARHDAVLLQHA
jgi:hypothetical protein